MYIYKYVYICMYVYIYVSKFVCMYVCMNLSMCVFTTAIKCEYKMFHKNCTDQKLTLWYFADITFQVIARYVIPFAVFWRHFNSMMGIVIIRLSICPIREVY